jgi:hypothetical protein
MKTALAALVLALAVSVATPADAAPADPPALICRVSPRLIPIERWPGDPCVVEPSSPRVAPCPPRARRCMALWSV